MRTSIFAAVAAISVLALMSLIQAPRSYASSAVTACGEAACPLVETVSGHGILDPVDPLRRLAKIELNLTIGCPRGFHWEGDECVLGRKHKRVECPQGLHWNGDRCVPDRKAKKSGGGVCVVGFHWNGEECVPDGRGQKKARGCPEGTEFIRGKCRKSEFPPIEGEGQEGGEGFSCSHNDHLENGTCVPCKEGFHVEGDECVAD